MDDIAQVLISGVGTSDPQKEDPARLSPTGVNVPAGLANEPPVRLKCTLTPLSLNAQCSSKYCTYCTYCTYTEPRSTLKPDYAFTKLN